MLIDLMPYKEIRIVLSAKALEVTKKGLVVETVAGNKELLLCDDLVVCVGFISDKELYTSILGKVPEVYLIGDANRVGNMMTAVWEAAEVALHL
jgi:2-enoate reductase